MRLALVFPKSTFLNDPMIWMPLGLGYLSAQLRAQGHETVEYKIKNYRDSGFIPSYVNPLQFAGHKEPILDWMHE